MKTETVTLQTHEGAMDVFVAWPAEITQEVFPAMIVLQEAFGVNHHIKDVCKRLAAEGYIAAAPELFHRAGKGLDIPYTEFMSQARAILGELTNDRMTDDMATTLKYLNSLPEVDNDKIGAIGFCMGGFAAILGATRLPLSVAVSFYGGGINKVRPGIGFSPLLTEFPKIKCPVLLAYGEKDHGISKEDRDDVSAAMEAANTDYDLRVYANADHGFLCDERPSYHPDAARTAWNETLEWLSNEL